MFSPKPILAALVLAALSGPALADHSPKHMHVFKSATCGCCAAWADIARRHGFDVTVEDREDMTAVKRSLGVAEAVESCHTARIGGYVVEGHVPMEAVDRLLAERPQVAGIAAPGMPAGSPGMGDDPDAEFDVLSFGGASAAPAVFHRAGKD
ncbi:DUF411 domain-containing protein [Aureimonas sp. N4]|uniref:DUF411 domain-containing protein n=1 Tax=Aureimonas sp. N4 TaxID=1638165 RepID=UPI000781941E|nr:DUF411 domain-containing protein [Aureimonas sp. N4]